MKKKKRPGKIRKTKALDPTKKKKKRPCRKQVLDQNWVPVGLTP